MYYIQNKLQVEWTFVIRDHMMKAKRLADFRFPYVVLIFKFIEHFSFELDDELQESKETTNRISCLTLQKMGFTKENSD